MDSIGHYFILTEPERLVRPLVERDGVESQVLPPDCYLIRNPFGPDRILRGTPMRGVYKTVGEFDPTKFEPRPILRMAFADKTSEPTGQYKLL